jgi:glucan biosynthesis protein
MARRKALTRLKVTKDKKVKLITFLSLEEIKAIKQAQVDFKLSLHEVVHQALKFGLKDLEQVAYELALKNYEEKKKQVENYLEKVRTSIN